MPTFDALELFFFLSAGSLRRPNVCSESIDREIFKKHEILIFSTLIVAFDSSHVPRFEGQLMMNFFHTHQLGQKVGHLLGMQQYSNLGPFMPNTS